MAAPTNAAGVKKVLANSEPSTHGPFRPRLLLSNLELITLETLSARIRPEDLDPLKGRFSGHPQHTGQPETDFRILDDGVACRFFRTLDQATAPVCGTCG
jgi:hypothetical protein